MRFVYCPYCGKKLIKKEIGDEGRIPFCEKCNIPLWDMFTTSIIAAVVNEEREIALLRQNYVSATSYVCVAGVMKPGESAEDAVIREVREEIGQKVERLEYIGSYPYEKKEMLMLGYKAVMKPGESAEDAVIREVREEIGQKVERLEYIGSYPYEKKEMLMLGYKASVKKRDFVLSGEVDAARWVGYENALPMLREGGVAWQLVKSVVGTF